MNPLQAFQLYLLRWYANYGRHELPWRQTVDPYQILVSEVMLQQTQVDRVIPKYQAFLTTFPTVEKLAHASLGEVLAQWQGLGYNRRAKYLQLTAQAVVKNWNGIFPKEVPELLQLPGVGPYTAAAICTFAYNQPTALIETNVRTVFLYHFFPNKEGVPDSELLPLITASIYQKNPREWYAALMDYGSTLKKLLPNPSRRSKHHTKQSTFTGSLRQVRGQILKILLTSPASSEKLLKQIQGNTVHLPAALAQLLSEHLVQETAGQYHLPK